MKKYYVTLGRLQALVMGYNTIQACILALRKMQETSLDVVDDDVDTGTIFRVSERGFDVHNDDERYMLYDIIKIMNVTNNPEPIPEN